VLRITNDDETYAEIPGLVITNPAQNLSTFHDGPTLSTPRRALASVGAQATTAARFVYAIGGDSGQVSGALDTVEVAPVDIFGQPGAFFTQQHRLTVPRTFVGAAVIDRCIYVAGGTNADSGVLASIERACVLDPKDRPKVIDLDLATSADTGLGQGLWYYQVAAVMPADHPSNPDGETLPSEPFPLLLPALNSRAIDVTIHWSQVSDAVGYRVYRSPSAGAAADALQLIATVNGATTTRYTDQGGTAQTARPLRLGATGTWHAVSTGLQVARQGAGVTTAPDPVDPTRHYLYVMGGRDASAAVLSSLELLPVTVNPDRSQTAGSLTAGSATLRHPRWQLGLFSVGNVNASFVTPPAQYVYAGGGVASNNITMVDDVDIFEVQAGGQLGNRTSADDMQPGRAGYGAAAANNFLFVFGGTKAKVDETATSIEICEDDTISQCTSGPPELENWNNASAHMAQKRYLLSAAVQSGFIYLLGGTTATEQATTSTEYTNW